MTPQKLSSMYTGISNLCWKYGQRILCYFIIPGGLAKNPDISEFKYT